MGGDAAKEALTANSESLPKSTITSKSGHLGDVCNGRFFRIWAKKGGPASAGRSLC